MIQMCKIKEMSTDQITLMTSEKVTESVCAVQNQGSRRIQCTLIQRNIIIICVGEIGVAFDFINIINKLEAGRKNAQNFN